MAFTDDQPRAFDLEAADGPSAKEAYAFVLTAFGLFGVIALVVALIIGPGKSTGTTTAGSEPVAVTLSDFAIAPTAITAVNGAGIHVTNKGNVQHNLAIDGTAFATPMIDPGQSAHLDLSQLGPGDYTVICQVPGHKDAGNEGHLAPHGGTGQHRRGRRSH